MASISKEEMNQAKEHGKVLQALDQAIMEMVDKKRNAENTVRLNYKKMQSAEVTKVLAGMGIDKINIDKDGIRVATLQNAGINTILQVSQMSALQLQSIEGVGEATASKIESNAKLLKMSVEKSAQVTLNAENPTAEISTIIQNLYFLIQNDGILKHAQALYNTYHDGIQRCASNIQIMSSGLKWMFTSKENKEVAQNAAVALSEIMAGEFGVVAPQLVEAYNTMNDSKIIVKGVDLQLLQAASADNATRMNRTQVGEILNATPVQVSQPTVQPTATVAHGMEQSSQVVGPIGDIRERSTQEVRPIGGIRERSAQEVRPIGGMRPTATQGMRSLVDSRQQASSGVRIIGGPRSQDNIVQPAMKPTTPITAQPVVQPTAPATAQPTTPTMAQPAPVQSITSIPEQLPVSTSTQNLVQTYTANARKIDCFTAFRQNSAPFYAMLEAVMGDSFAKAAETGMNALPEELLQSIENFPLNTGSLKATLRRYQTFGTKYILHQERVLLGDEMGLGKTMQALAAFCHLAEGGARQFLVVCPLSVVVNWKREVESQTGLQAIEVYGDNRAMEMTMWAAQGGVAITSFETLNKLPIPAVVDLQLMVVDEAHYVKNPQAQRTQSVMAAAARAKRVLFMSGTPLENKVEEMEFLIQCLQPQVAEKIKDLKQIIHAEEFRKAIAPVYLRRVREDVLKELPELVEKEQWGLMNQDEMNAYKDALVNGSFMAVRQVSWQLSDMAKSTKAQRLKEICEDAKEGGRKLIIFSFFKDVLNKVSTLLGEYCIGVIDGSVPASERQGMIDKLKDASAGSALVCQIQAGGVGLNIQAASVVVFCEPQIKPSLETQAVARAYRMGQSQSVMVHRLLMDDTVDERVMEILKQKSQLFDSFADESLIGEMDTQINENTVMKDIVAEERKRLGLANPADDNTGATGTVEATLDNTSAIGTEKATSDNTITGVVGSDVAVEEGN